MSVIECEKCGIHAIQHIGINNENLCINCKNAERVGGIKLESRSLSYEPTEFQMEKAKLLASFVRSEIEDFHCEHLTNKQMKELNPLIRNGIVAGLYYLDNVRNERIFKALNFQIRLIPDYWENPVISDMYKPSDKNEE